MSIAGYGGLAAEVASPLGMGGPVPGGVGPLAVVLFCLAAVTCPAVGGIVIIRRLGHPAGWLLMGIGLG